MSLKNFLVTRVFAKHLGLAAVILVGILILLLIWLNLYTRHGQSRVVPDFHGRTRSETARLARKSRLKYVIIDSVYTSAVGPGCIAGQTPPAGFRVKKWRRINLTINAINPEMVAAPDLVGLPKRQAIAVMGTAGLEIGQRFYIPDLSVDFVLKQLHNGQEVKPGEFIRKGSVIDLVLGKGLSNKRAAVPNLIGMNLTAAKNEILSSSMNLGTFVYDSTIVSGLDSVNAFVFKQNPDFSESATLQLGSAIYLWLTVDSAKLPVDSTLVSRRDSLGINKDIK
ncbi:MAG TPA: PASTA domain-containing protein [Bacteroidales bacterium]|nr:PASTA domain-containing protein [Bacteroidales bacterium]